MAVVDAVATAAVFWAFPLFCLIRAAYRGWEGGLSTRLPGKLVAVGLGMALVLYIQSKVGPVNQATRCKAWSSSISMLLAIFLPSFVGLMYLARIWLLEDRLALLLRPKRGALRVVDGLLGSIVEIWAMAWIIGVLYMVARFYPPPVMVLIVNAPLGFNSVIVDLLGGQPTFLSLFVELIGGLEQNVGGSLASGCLHDSTAAVDLELWVVGIISSFIFAPAAVAVTFDPILYSGRFFLPARQGSQDQCRECGGRGIYTTNKPLLVGMACRTCWGSGAATEVRVRSSYEGGSQDYFEPQRHRSWRNLPFNPTELQLRKVIVMGYVGCFGIALLSLLLHLAMAG